MGNDRRAKNVSILILLASVMLAPGKVSAGGHTHRDKSGNNPSAGYPAPVPTAYAFPGANIDSTYSACCYTFPIQAVYQCPAVLAGQPGSRVAYLWSDPTFGLLGGQPYLYHP